MITLLSPSEQSYLPVVLRGGGQGSEQAIQDQNRGIGTNQINKISR